MLERLEAWIESPQIRRAILWVILANAVILGLKTVPPAEERIGELLSVLDWICLAIFVVELSIKIFVRRLRFFTKGWGLFDLVVVGIGLVPDGQGLTVLRSLRILRVLRVISVAPNLRRVVEGFLCALPGMGSVFLLMVVIFYIGAVIATKVFGAAYPEWFGHLGRSAYSLFQIMTLESWSMGIVRPVMQDFPHAWVFFVPFIVVTTFAVMNLLVGLIVNAMQDAHHAEDEGKRLARHEDILERLGRIESQLGQVRSETGAGAGGGANPVAQEPLGRGESGDSGASRDRAD